MIVRKILSQSEHHGGPGMPCLHMHMHTILLKLNIITTKNIRIVSNISLLLTSSKFYTLSLVTKRYAMHQIQVSLKLCFFSAYITEFWVPFDLNFFINKESNEQSFLRFHNDHQNEVSEAEGNLAAATSNRNQQKEFQ